MISLYIQNILRFYVSEDKEIEETTANNEMDRLKNLEAQNNSMKEALQVQMQKNQAYEQIFARMSAFLGEILATTARTTYVATIIKDILDNRNSMSSWRGTFSLA